MPPKDNVYSQCMYIHVSYLDTSQLSHLSLLPCPDTYKQVGDPCASVDDCRPVKPAAAERLVCDPTSNTCIPAGRPAAPPDYGQSCGLINASYSGYEDVAMPGDQCELCHARWDSTAGCLRQGCTMGCKYDEDCPAGSVCVCVPNKTIGEVVQICAATDERDTAPGRTKNLKCYPFPDAGTDGPGDGGPPDTGDLG